MAKLDLNFDKQKQNLFLYIFMLRGITFDNCALSLPSNKTYYSDTLTRYWPTNLSMHKLSIQIRLSLINHLTGLHKLNTFLLNPHRTIWVVSNQKNWPSTQSPRQFSLGKTKDASWTVLVQFLSLNRSTVWLNEERGKVKWLFLLSLPLHF